ncbi:MAG TPA: hypothetical protein VI139_03100 [Gemmatimonadales bacterium]
MRGASVIALLVAAACGGGPPGLAPDAAPAQPLTAHADGHFDGAALGWTLGSEVHLFVADSAFTQQVYDSLLRAKFGPKPPAAPMLSLGGDKIATRPTMPGYYDATILFPGGASPADLVLVRLHQPGRCGAASAVVELIYSFPQAAAPLVPRAHTTVVGYFREPAFFAEQRRPAAAPPDSVSRRLLAGLARAAVRRTAPHRAATERLAAPLAADPDAEADAGEVQRLSGGAYAAALRARVVSGPRDTALVTGVALVDGDGMPQRWFLGPTRSALVGGSIREPDGGPAAPRYVLRGVVAFPPEHGTLLLIDAISDVSPRASRSIVVDPRSMRVVAAQPLALHCP